MKFIKKNLVYLFFFFLGCLPDFNSPIIFPPPRPPRLRPPPVSPRPPPVSPPVSPLTALTSVYNLIDDVLELRGAISVSTAEVGGNHYLFVAGRTDNGVSGFKIKDDGTLKHVQSVRDEDDDTFEDDDTLKLRGAISVSTAEVGGNHYLFVAGYDDDGVSGFRIKDDGTLKHVQSVDDDDDDTLELKGAYSVSTAEVGGNHYLFVAGRTDNGVSVFRIKDDGTLEHVQSVRDEDDDTLELKGVASVSTAEVGGNHYLFVGGYDDDGVSGFKIKDDGTLKHVQSVRDEDDDTLKLRGVISVSTAEVGGNHYLFVAGSSDNGVSVFKIKDKGTLKYVQSVDGDTLESGGTYSVSTAEVRGNHYLFVGGNDGVSMLKIKDGGTLEYVQSVSDDTFKLRGAYSVSTAELGGNHYLFVAGYDDDGVSVFKIKDKGTLEHVQSVGDDLTLELDGVATVSTVEVGGNHYLFVAGKEDNGVSVFRIKNDGILEHVQSVGDNEILELDGVVSVSTAEVGGNHYLFVGGYDDDGVSVFKIKDDETLEHVQSVSDDNTLELDGVASVSTAEVGGNHYLFVAGRVDNGVSGFKIKDNGTLEHVQSVSDDNTLELDGVVSVSTTEVGGNHYLFVGGYNDDGVSVFKIKDDGTLEHVQSVSDDNTLELDGVASVSTAEVGGNHYLFVAGRVDNGVSVFKIKDNGTLEHVQSVGDNPTLELYGAYSVSTAEVGENHYLFVAGFWDDGVSVFKIKDDGTLEYVQSVGDNDILALGGVVSVSTTEVGGNHYLFVAGHNDDGVSVFKIE